jgi:hypothetical protein
MPTDIENPEEVRKRRFDLMHAMRHERQSKGLYARDRAAVPAERAVSRLPQAA